MFAADLSPDGHVLILTDAGQNPVRFHAIWLRDNARDAQTRAPGNGQRLITLADIPRDTYINSAQVEGAMLTLVFQPENKAVAFDIHALLAQRYDTEKRCEPGWTAPQVVLWDAGLMGSVPVASLPRIQADAGAKRDWLAQVARYGFGKLTDGPVSDGALFNVVDLFGHTHLRPARVDVHGHAGASTDSAVARRLAPVEHPFPTLQDRRDLVGAETCPTAGMHPGCRCESQRWYRATVSRQPNDATRMRDSRRDGPATKDARERRGDGPQHRALERQDSQVRKDRAHEALEVELAGLDEAAEGAFRATERAGKGFAEAFAPVQRIRGIGLKRF